MTIRFVADVGSNHNQNLDRCLEFVRVSKKIGCYGVKFQLFVPELLYSKEFPDKIEKMKKWALPHEFIIPIKKECRKQQIKFVCTPFDFASLDKLIGVVDILKIGSYEILWKSFIELVSQTGIPWMYSTGMCDFAFTTVLPYVISVPKKNHPFAIFHCNSNYPAKPENCNLSRIKEIKNLFPPNIIEVGWSDHSKHSGVVLTAVTLGATVIEFHIDLDDGLGFESCFGHCWKAKEAKCLIKTSNILKERNLTYPKINQWIYSETNEEEAKKWRTDPFDGMRPLKEFRKELSEK